MTQFTCVIGFAFFAFIVDTWPSDFGYEHAYTPKWKRNWVSTEINIPCFRQNSCNLLFRPPLQCHLIKNTERVKALEMSWMKPEVMVKFKLLVKLTAALVVSYLTIVIKEVNSSCSGKIQQSFLLRRGWHQALLNMTSSKIWKFTARTFNEITILAKWLSIWISIICQRNWRTSQFIGKKSNRMYPAMSSAFSSWWLLVATFLLIRKNCVILY